MPFTQLHYTECFRRKGKGPAGSCRATEQEQQLLQKQQLDLEQKQFLQKNPQQQERQQQYQKSKGIAESSFILGRGSKPLSPLVLHREMSLEEGEEWEGDDEVEEGEEEGQDEGEEGEEEGEEGRDEEGDEGGLCSPSSPCSLAAPVLPCMVAPSLPR